MYELITLILSITLLIALVVIYRLVK